jgi:two-component system, OmpR family, sensor kinase
MLARWNDLPLRLRLTFLYVGLLLLLFVAFGSYLYIDTRNFMITVTALRLEALANTSVTHLLPPPGPGSQPFPGPRDSITSTFTLNPPPFETVARNLARDLTWQDYSAAIIDRSGTRIADGSEFSGLAAIPAPEPGALARTLDGEQATYVTTISGQDSLVVLVPIHFPRMESPIVGVVQMTASLGIVDQILQRQRWLIVSGVGLALLLATIGGMWLTHTALMPLQLMVATSRRIAAGDLSQRVNLPQRKDETGQLASAFDEMVAQLEDTFTAQRQFVADASHELRTPLTAISGSLEVLLLAPEGDPATTHRVLNGMRREVQRLSRLVSDLLTLTRLDARRPLNLHAVDLAGLGGEVVEGMRPLARDREMVLQTDGDTKCVGDADQLKQIFYNLLGNAIQSTDEAKGKIAIKIQGRENDVRVAISDNGIGIPDQAQMHIFERFYRVDKARARVGGGSGLGLAIVKAIVDGHGGCIEPVESQPGQGTTIRFVLPRHPAE